MRDRDDRWGRCETHGGLVDETELIYIPATNTLTCAECVANEIERREVAR